MCLDIDVSASVKAEQRRCCLLFGSLLAQVISRLKYSCSPSMQSSF